MEGVESILTPGSAVRPAILGRMMSHLDGAAWAVLFESHQILIKDGQRVIGLGVKTFVSSCDIRSVSSGDARPASQGDNTNTGPHDHHSRPSSRVFVRFTLDADQNDPSASEFGSEDPLEAKQLHPRWQDSPFVVFSTALSIARSKQRV
jgi:hypothetical protein